MGAAVIVPCCLACRSKERVVKDYKDEIFKNDANSSNVFKQTDFWSWQESILVFNVNGSAEHHPILITADKKICRPNFNLDQKLATPPPSALKGLYYHKAATTHQGFLMCGVKTDNSSNECCYWAKPEENYQGCSIVKDSGLPPTAATPGGDEMTGHLFGSLVTDQLRPEFQNTFYFYSEPTNKTNNSSATGHLYKGEADTKAGSRTKIKWDKVSLDQIEGKRLPAGACPLVVENNLLLIGGSTDGGQTLKSTLVYNGTSWYKVEGFPAGKRTYIDCLVDKEANRILTFAKESGVEMASIFLNDTNSNLLTFDLPKILLPPVRDLTDWIKIENANGALFQLVSEKGTEIVTLMLGVCDGDGGGFGSKCVWELDTSSSANNEPFKAARKVELETFGSTVDGNSNSEKLDFVNTAETGYAVVRTDFFPECKDKKLTFPESSKFPGLLVDGQGNFIKDDSELDA